MNGRAWVSKLVFEEDIELDSRAAFFLSLLFVFRGALNLIDLFGVAVLSFLAGAITTGTYPPSPINVAGIVPEGNVTQNGAVLLAVFGVGAFLLKGLLAMTTLYFSTRYAVFLEARYSKGLFQGFISRDRLSSRNGKPESLQLVFARGARARVAGLLNSKLDLFGETSLFFILGLAMIVFTPLIGVAALFFMGASFFLLLRVILPRVRKQQREVQATDFNSLSTVRAASSIATELRISNSSVKNYWINELVKVRRKSGLAFSNLRILQAAPRYALELLAITGLSLLVGLVVVFSSLQEQGASLGFAAAALFRIGTSLIPVQSATQYLQRSRTDAKLVSDYMEAFPASQSERMSYSETGSFVQISAGERFSINRDMDLVFEDNFRVAEQELVSIRGESGAGKSSFLHALLQKLCTDPSFSKTLAYCPQSPALVSGGLVENILLRDSRDELERITVLELAKSLNLDDWPGSYNKHADDFNISGGQLLRVGIARALISKPDFLLLDEPTSALDGATANEILALLRRSYKGGILAATHDLDVISQSDRVYNVTRSGRIISISESADTL